MPLRRDDLCAERSCRTRPERALGAGVPAEEMSVRCVALGATERTRRPDIDTCAGTADLTGLDVRIKEEHHEAHGTGKR